MILAASLVSALLLLIPPAPPEPVTLEIEALGVTASVTTVGNTADRGMEIPSDLSTVGWWEHGTTPGETGNAVMVAHVSGRVDGVPTRGIFYDLIDLEIGDSVMVINHDSAEGQVAFTVTEVVVIPKDELPWERMFSTEGPPGLVLVTCGGLFNGETRHFESNVIVYARMVP